MKVFTKSTGMASVSPVEAEGLASELLALTREKWGEQNSCANRLLSQYAPLLAPGLRRLAAAHPEDPQLASLLKEIPPEQKNRLPEVWQPIVVKSALADSYLLPVTDFSLASIALRFHEPGA